jgi:superoxide dismutase
MAYEVPPLPYDYNALEPTIDQQTMTLHHDKHHQAYVDKANGALEGKQEARGCCSQHECDAAGIKGGRPGFFK